MALTPAIAHVYKVQATEVHQTGIQALHTDEPSFTRHAHARAHTHAEAAVGDSRKHSRRQVERSWCQPTLLLLLCVTLGNTFSVSGLLPPCL